MMKKIGLLLVAAGLVYVGFLAGNYQMNSYFSGGMYHLDLNALMLSILACTLVLGAVLILIDARRRVIAREWYVRSLAQRLAKALNSSNKGMTEVLTSGLVDLIDVGGVSYGIIEEVFMKSTAYSTSKEAVSSAIAIEVRRRLESDEWRLASARGSRKRLINEYAFAPIPATCVAG